MKIKPVFDVKALKKEMEGISNGPLKEGGYRAAVQRFVKSKGTFPWYCHSTWTRSGRRGVVTLRVCTSGFPYISNIGAHLDPGGVPRGHCKWWIGGSEDGMEELEGEVRMTIRGMCRGWGKGVRIKKVSMDWIRDEETEEW